MTNQQAIKVIEKAIAPRLKQLAFGANLYDAGSHESFAVRAFKERQKINQAMEVLAAPQMSLL